MDYDLEQWFSVLALEGMMGGPSSGGAADYTKLDCKWAVDVLNLPTTPMWRGAGEYRHRAWQLRLLG